MLTLYIFSFVLGGGFLAISFLAGDAGDGDLGLEGGFELEGGLDLDGGLELDAGTDLEVLDAGQALDAADASGSAAKILSLRGLVYALFGFGATGTLLTSLGVGSAATLVASVVTGFASSALVTWAFNYLRRTDSGSLPGDRAFAGALGRVVLPLSAGSAGAVVVRRGDREIRLRALPHASGSGDPAGWERVMVVEVDSGIARVVPVEGDHLLEP